MNIRLEKAISVQSLLFASLLIPCLIQAGPDQSREEESWQEARENA